MSRLPLDLVKVRADSPRKSTRRLTDDKSKFVHMSGAWKEGEELDMIKARRIWYKNAIVHDVTVPSFGTELR